ncbi:MAG TPA: sugar ABC transporter permease, partial [Firmicutes bacterium]|nr:sugar ABC transporter permease [Bacillota bacterium]
MSNVRFERWGSRRLPGPPIPVKASRVHQGRDASPYAFMLPAVVALLIVTFAPFIGAVLLSLGRYDLLRPWLGWQFRGLGNFIDVLHDGAFWQSAYTTLKFTTFALSGETLLGVAIALFLNRDFKGKGLVRTLLLAPMIISPVVVGLVWRMLYNADVGMVNYFFRLMGLPAHPWLGDPATALWAVAVADIWQWTPYIVMVTLAALESLPLDYFEVARIEGASFLQTLQYVTLPLIKPVLLVATIVRTMDLLNAFGTIFVMTNGGPGRVTETLVIYGYKTGFNFFHIGYAS